jgi:hypothetical protein
MFYSELPENPNKRKAIVFLDKHIRDDIERTKKLYDGKDFNLTDHIGLEKGLTGFIESFIEMRKLEESTNIAVLAYFKGDEKKSPLYQSLDKDGLLGDGMVLWQSPYDVNHYEEARDVDSFLQSNALQKYQLFSELCGKLGATRIYGKQFEIANDGENTQIDGKTSYKAVSGEFQRNSSWENNVRQELELEDTYSGNSNPNIEEARKFLIDNNLSTDRVFSSLVSGRAGENKILSRNLSFSLTTESKKLLDITGNISLFRFKANGNYKNEVNALRDLKITLSVEFGKG